MKHDIINDALSKIKNYERLGKKECVIPSKSKLLVNVLHVFQKEGFIGEFEVSEDACNGEVRVKLVGKINDCGVIKPRFSSEYGEFTKWEKRFLPSRDFGTLVVSTSKGVVSHNEAKKLAEGGRLLAFVY